MKVQIEYNETGIILLLWRDQEDGYDEKVY